MVQVLPYVQSPLEQLNPYIQGAAQAAGGVARSYLNQRGDASVLQQIQAKADSGTGSAMDYATLWGKLSEGARKKYEPFLNSNLRIQEAKAKEESKRETQSKEKAEKATVILDVAKEMEDLLPYVGSTEIPFTKSFAAGKYGINREGLQQREKFDELAASAASFFRDLETKGQLPLGLYEKVIEPRLPSSKISERQNKGRIEGLVSLAKKYGGLEEKKPPSPASKVEEPKLSEGQSFEKLPSASEYPNAIFRKGDKRYMSDGKSWKQT